MWTPHGSETVGVLLQLSEYRPHTVSADHPVFAASKEPLRTAVENRNFLTTTTRDYAIQRTSCSPEKGTEAKSTCRNEASAHCFATENAVHFLSVCLPLRSLRVGCGSWPDDGKLPDKNSDCRSVAKASSVTHQVSASQSHPRAALVPEPKVIEGGRAEHKKCIRRAFTQYAGLFLQVFYFFFFDSKPRAMGPAGAFAVGYSSRSLPVP